MGTAPADGYEFCSGHAEMVPDYKASAGIGRAADALGLDAVMVVNADVSLERRGRSLVLHELALAVVDTPDDDPEVDISGFIGSKRFALFREGLCMGFSNFKRPLDKPIEIAKMGKKEKGIKDWFLGEGLAHLTARMTNDVYRGMQSYTDLERRNKRDDFFEK